MSLVNIYVTHHYNPTLLNFSPVKISEEKVLGPLQCKSPDKSRVILLNVVFIVTECENYSM